MTDPRTLDSATDLTRQIAANRAIALRPLVVVGGAAGAVALVGLLLPFVVGPAALMLIVVACGGAFWGVRRLGTGEQQALALCSARLAAPAENARLFNVVDGLCASTGIAAPALLVVDDPSCNCFVVGNDPRRASLVVTSGLLEYFEPIELEGIVAQQLGQIRNLRIAPATRGVMWPSLRTQLGEHREYLADCTAVDITRYPPGLAAALEKMLEHRGDAGAVVSLPALAHLWTDPPGVSSAPLELRAAALRER